MLHTRALLYFDEVARRGSIRRASEHLNIAASAVDRQILQLEQFMGAPLFDRTTRGLLLTAAGEVLVDSVRRTKREMAKTKAQIDDLQGLRRGEVSIATVEGGLALLEPTLIKFHRDYPSASHRILIAPASVVAELVVENQFDVGLTFNPPGTHALRPEKTLIYQLGVAIAPEHPLTLAKATVHECNQYPLILPDESISLRAQIEKVWQRQTGSPPVAAFELSGFALIKRLAISGCGVALVTEADVINEVKSGELVFLPLEEEKMPISVLSLITANGRSLSVLASLFVKYLSEVMMSESDMVI